MESKYKVIDSEINCCVAFQTVKDNMTLIVCNSNNKDHEGTMDLSYNGQLLGLLSTLERCPLHGSVIFCHIVLLDEDSCSLS